MRWWHLSFLGLELDQGNLLGVEAVVADPLGVYLLSQVVESHLRQTSAGSVEPEVAARLAEDGLVILVNLLPADATRIYWWGGGVLLVEDDWLVWRVDRVSAERSRCVRRSHVQGWRSHARRPGGGTDPPHTWVCGARTPEGVCWAGHGVGGRCRAGSSRVEARLGGTWCSWVHPGTSRSWTGTSAVEPSRVYRAGSTVTSWHVHHVAGRVRWRPQGHCRGAGTTPVGTVRTSRTSWAQSRHRGHRVSGAHAAHRVTHWRLHRTSWTHHHSCSLSHVAAVHHPTVGRSIVHHVIRTHRNWTIGSHPHRSVGSHHHHLRSSRSSWSSWSSHTTLRSHHHRSIWSHHGSPRSHHSRRSHARRHHTTFKRGPVHVIGSHHALTSVHGMVWWRPVILIVFPFLLGRRSRRRWGTPHTRSHHTSRSHHSSWTHSSRSHWSSGSHWTSWTHWTSRSHSSRSHWSSWPHWTPRSHWTSRSHWSSWTHRTSRSHHSARSHLSSRSHSRSRSRKSEFVHRWAVLPFNLELFWKLNGLIWTGLAELTTFWRLIRSPVIIDKESLIS